MYRRYSEGNLNVATVGQKRKNRVKNILLLVLTLALVVMTVLGVPALNRQREERGAYVQRMRNEVNEAVSQTAALSRNAGASSSATLARIRSNVHAIRAVNDLSIARSGASGRILDESELSKLESSVDNFLDYLTRGMDTGEYQTNLQNDLLALQSELNDM